MTDGATGRARAPQTYRLPARRPGVAPLAKIGMLVFAVGLFAIGVIMVLFASGARDLPVWLNLLAVLAPVGLGTGFAGVFLEARRRRRPPAPKGPASGAPAPGGPAPGGSTRREESA